MEILTFYNLFLINSIIILFYVFFEFSAFDLLRRALFGLLDPAPLPNSFAQLLRPATSRHRTDAIQNSKFKIDFPCQPNWGFAR